MSLTYITHHNECIYNIRLGGPKPPEEAPPGEEIVIPEIPCPNKPPQPLYISKHRDRLLKEQEILKCRPKKVVHHICPPNPKKFLRKGTGKPLQSKCLLQKVERTNVPQPPSIDKDFEKKYLEERKKRLEEIGKKNFIYVNKQYLKTMKVQPESRIIIMNNFGAKTVVKEYVEPQIKRSKNFGKLPNYLKKFIMQHQNLTQAKKELGQVDSKKCRYITRVERDELLNGLKHNWEELQKQFQGLPILTDTLPKVLRKLKLEKKLEAIEKDILLVEKHPHIYVYDDDELPEIKVKQS